jgi:hypothetical protein
MTHHVDRVLAQWRASKSESECFTETVSIIFQTLAPRTRMMILFCFDF